VETSQNTVSQKPCQSEKGEKSLDLAVFQREAGLNGVLKSAHPVCRPFFSAFFCRKNAEFKRKKTFLPHTKR
jgi:hypothetical protein